MTDTLTPQYIILNPDGTVSADFSGKISASKGVDLPAASAYGSDNSVEWTNGPGGALIAFVGGSFAQATPSDARIQVTAQAADNQGDAYANIIVNDETGGFQAGLSVGSVGPSPNRDNSISLLLPSGTRTLFDDTNKTSVFAQVANNLADLANKASALLNLGINVGQASVTFSNSTVSNYLYIPHGLGVVPAYFGAIITDNLYGGINPIYRKSASDGTNAQIVWVSQTSLSLTVNFVWFAVGNG